MTNTLHLIHGGVLRRLRPVPIAMMAQYKLATRVESETAAGRHIALARSTRGQLVWVIFLACGLGIFLTGCGLRSGKQPRNEVSSLYSVSSPEFRQTAGSMLGPGFVSGNSITTLVNGREIFPALLSAIRGAKRSINFETYVYDDGQIGHELAAALAERARIGIKVGAVLDAQGTQTMGKDNAEAMRDAGVEVLNYHSVMWFDPRRYNHRTHRKLLIIDGKTAFIGGVGIADEWTGNADSQEH